MESVSNWGFYPKVKAKVIRTSNQIDVPDIVRKSKNLIARGNGRCYGDSSLQEIIFSTTHLKKIIEFDKVNGVLQCESGLLLSEILEVTIPEGYFLPVSPGTKFITIGGAVASNIHGKNHHKEGAISKYIISMEIVLKDGSIVTCSHEQHSELFRETIGGMGLTGIITSIKFKLKAIETAYIKQRSIKAKNITELFGLFESNEQYLYSVAWIDCMSRGSILGRSILLLGEHETLADLPSKYKKDPLKLHSSNQINIPFMFPSFVLNKFSIKIFNFIFYHKLFSKEKLETLHYDQYFYPLDSINNWNRIYGKNGFTQYQFVIPFENGREGMMKILEKISSSGVGSFLAVLKTFGDKDIYSSKLSFPTKGYTLALDFKLSEKVMKLLEELDKIVIEYGGKLYLTKDSRMSNDTFHIMYPHIGIDHSGHKHKFSSMQSLPT